MATAEELMATIAPITNTLERVEDVLAYYLHHRVKGRRDALRREALALPDEQVVLSLLEDLSLLAEDRGFAWTILIGPAP